VAFKINWYARTNKMVISSRKYIGPRFPVGLSEAASERLIDRAAGPSIAWNGFVANPHFMYCSIEDVKTTYIINSWKFTPAVFRPRAVVNRY